MLRWQRLEAFNPKIHSDKIQYNSATGEPQKSTETNSSSTKTFSFSSCSEAVENESHKTKQTWKLWHQQRKAIARSIKTSNINVDTLTAYSHSHAADFLKHMQRQVMLCTARQFSYHCNCASVKSIFKKVKKIEFQKVSH